MKVRITRVQGNEYSSNESFYNLDIRIAKNGNSISDKDYRKITNAMDRIIQIVEPFIKMAKK